MFFVSRNDVDHYAFVIPIIKALLGRLLPTDLILWAFHLDEIQIDK